ncbi:calcium release-activated calcium channel protein 1-like [Neocloeon triangulifer]|uniref:calcium release-activated calcium channel protein 1-like n=1 Tax=Neocloeon triangulifer TaxID=2078957 RepID=UPI00286EEE52|nr:calcium release-activated calcium channel protein 1-like [Neocloeon triangulifer]
MPNSLKILETKEGIQWRNFHYAHAKLQMTTRTSTFLVAFGTGILTSYQFNSPTAVPSFVVSLLSVNSVILIALHAFSVIIGTCLLPNFQVAKEEYVAPQEGQTKMNAVPSFSPHEQYSRFIKASQRISNVFGLLIFLLEVPLVAWVKFWDVSQTACIACTAITIPIMALFVIFVWYFNFKYKTHIYHTRQILIDEVEEEYKSRSQESLHVIHNFNQVHQMPKIVSRRHSLDANFRPGSPPCHLEMKFHSQPSLTLETVFEE